MLIRASGGVPEFCQLSVAKLPELGPPLPALEVMAEILCLNTDDLVGGDWQPQAYSCGLPFAFVAVRSREAVARARRRIDKWESALKGHWGSEIFVFTMSGERPGSHVHARMFAPGLNVPEDPATGSANAALAGYLASRSATKSGMLAWRVEQGFEMGRPSIVEVETDVTGGIPSAVRVGGNSVVVCEGTINITS